MAPRLTEIFVFKEASAHGISSTLKIPIQFADAFIKLYGPKKDMAMAKLYAFEKRRWINEWIQDFKNSANYPQNQQYMIQYLREEIPRWAESQLQNGSYSGAYKPGTNAGVPYLIHMIQDGPEWVAPFVTKWPMAENDWDSVSKLAYEVYRVEASKKPRLDSSRAEIKYPDGFGWYHLQGEECKGEGDEMSHCGVANDKMYSLRDKKGHPHVTIDFLEEPTARVNSVNQVRGKGNTRPDPKYWDYIKDFLKRKNAEIYDGKHQDDAEFLQYVDPSNYWLTGEDKQEVTITRDEWDEIMRDV